MNPNGQGMPTARKMDLVTREMPDEVLVYDLKHHKAHCLNQTAVLVWKHCDGKKSVAEIAATLSEEINLPVDEAAVWLAVDQLGKAHLLESRVARSADQPRLSRREAVRRLGWGAALAVPVVMSIVSPLAVSAQSCVATTGMTDCMTGPLSMTNNACCTMCCDGATSGTCLQNGLATGAACSENCQCTSGTCNGMTNTCN